MRAVSILLGLGLTVAGAGDVGATANYVYHERTTADTGGTPPCGKFVEILSPTSSQLYTLRFKVEYVTYTNQVRVYYTTDGSNPTGALGVGGLTTGVVKASYGCMFPFGGQTLDVAAATLPVQPAGTTVKYIVSAWHDQGGPEVFANNNNTCNSAGCATVFSYDSVCGVDGDCGGAMSGQVCNTISKCAAGCRGSGGNGCPSGQTCTSSTTAQGICEVPDMAAPVDLFTIADLATTPDLATTTDLAPPDLKAAATDLSSPDLSAPDLAPVDLTAAAADLGGTVDLRADLVTSPPDYAPVLDLRRGDAGARGSTGGCGCRIPGVSDEGTLTSSVLVVIAALLAGRRRRAQKTK